MNPLKTTGTGTRHAHLCTNHRCHIHTHRRGIGVATTGKKGRGEAPVHQYRHEHRERNCHCPANENLLQHGKIQLARTRHATVRYSNPHHRPDKAMGRGHGKTQHTARQDRHRGPHLRGERFRGSQFGDFPESTENQQYWKKKVNSNRKMLLWYTTHIVVNTPLLKMSN